MFIQDDEKVLMAIRKLVLTIVLCACWAGPLEAQERMSRAQALEDIRYVINSLEEIHPDPYSAFGGMLEFKRRFQELLDLVPEDGLAAAEIYELLRPLFGKLSDGHTYISSPPATGPARASRYLPVRFGIATDAVFIESTTGDYEGLIGGRLIEVEGQSVERAAALATTVFPAENRFGAERWLVRYLASNRGARRLFPHVGDTLSVKLRTIDGELLETHLPYKLDREAYRGGEWTARRWDAITDHSGPFSWQFIERSNVALMRVGSIVGREAFEELKAVGRKDLEEQLAGFYRRYMDEPLPESIDEAIAAVPCFTLAVHDLLTAMSERQSEYLILDLRGNGGGWSSLLTPFLLLTYGDQYFNYDYPVTFVTRISPSYLALNGQTLEEFNAEVGSDFAIGDYRFMEERSLAAATNRDEYAAELESYGCGLADYFRGREGRAVYTPKVAVLVDPATFSAAYHFVYRLWHLGAKTVGVPSAQAANAFVDVTPFQLPHSRLEGSIARTAQILFPDGGDQGRALMPEFPMAWRDFERYDFDQHSELRYAVDLITSGSMR